MFISARLARSFTNFSAVHCLHLWLCFIPFYYLFLLVFLSVDLLTFMMNWVIFSSLSKFEYLLLCSPSNGNWKKRNPCDVSNFGVQPSSIHRKTSQTFGQTPLIHTGISEAERFNSFLIFSKIITQSFVSRPVCGGLHSLFILWPPKPLSTRKVLRLL